MLRQLSYKTKQFLFLLVKLSIVVGASYFVYQKLIANDALDFQVFFEKLNKSKIILPQNITLLLVLMALNWFLEIIKWQQLVYSFKTINIGSATREVLGSLTASLITPNRIGEYGAKALYHPSKDRTKIMGLNFVGNSAQMLVTLLFGGIGFLLFVTQHNIELPYRKLSRVLVFGLMLSGGLLFGKNKKTSFILKPYEQAKSFLKSIPKLIYCYSFLLALLRYAIFSYQFFLLMKFYDVSYNYQEMIIPITAMYLITSIVPTLYILDIVIKVSAAVWLFSHLGIDEITTMSVTLLMWILNFVLPSIIGIYYVLTYRLNKVSK